MKHAKRNDWGINMVEVKDEEKKTVLYVSNDYFSYNKAVERQLQNNGHNVISCSYSVPTPNFLMRKYYSCKKLSYQQDCLNKYKKNLYEVAQRENIDIVLVGFSWIKRDIVLDLKRICTNAKFILFLVDDVQLVREQYEGTVDLFDFIFSYSPIDAEKYGLIYNPNFYAEEILNDKVYDWSFVGTAPESRAKVLESLLEKNGNMNYYMHIYKGAGGLKDRIYSEIFHNYGSSGLAVYYQYKSLENKRTLDIFSKSRCLLDIQHPWQKGLSMRPFHAMSMHTKLITSNPEIANYDFYRPNNIWIMDYENPSFPDEEFIYGKYEELPLHIYEKYSIEQWCKRIEKYF